MIYRSTNHLPPRLAGWRECRRCGLHAFRRQVVIGEGPFPSDIVLVGEGPGKSEDLVGRPFVGKAGRVLRAALVRASELSEVLPSCYVTNVVACRPCDDRASGNREPTPEEALACIGRLTLIMDLCKPKRVVLMGNVPQALCAKLCPGAARMNHPSFISRMGGLESVEYRLFVRQMEEVFGSLGIERTAVGVRRRKVMRRIPRG